MTIAEIKTELLKAKNVLIFSHNRPDGDTVGSATALSLALRKLGIDTSLVCAYDIPKKLSYLKGVEEYKKEGFKAENYSLFVSVDCSSESVFSDIYGLYSSHKKTMNLDHHVSNTRYAKFNFVKDCSATCELIYELINELGVEIDKDIATSLLTGIVTDTGGFYHSNVTPETLYIASKLKSAGADLHEIIYENFKKQTKERSNLYTKVISKLRYELDGKVGIITISKNDLEECNADQSMTEGFIDYAMTIDSVEVAISLLETGKNRYKISLRSKGKVDVNEIASLYGGGGHILASGVLMNGYLEDIISKLCYNVMQRL